MVEGLLKEQSRELPKIMTTAVLEAWEIHTLMLAQRKGFFLVGIPVDGDVNSPSLFVFSDARYVGAPLDRNGVRAARFFVTTDDIMIMASEVGHVEPPPHAIKQKGRLQPGRMLLVDTSKHVF